VKAAAASRINKEIEVAIDKQLIDFETERLGLAEVDKDQREIVLAIRKLEVEEGRKLNDIEKEKLTNGYKAIQNDREQLGIKQAIYEFTRQQTDLEKINRGLNLQKSLGGAEDLTKEYDKDLEALKLSQIAANTATEEALKQRLELTTRYNQKMQDLELNRIETVLMADRSANATLLSEKDKQILQQIGANEKQKTATDARIEFEKKSEFDKTQFGIQQAANLFTTLGAYNKRAFEAAKAFNIANAIMNTFTAATAQLKLPPPFGYIAAAAVVAAGLAQVAQIRAQTYSGRALGGPVMGGKSYIVGESGPELFTPSTTGSITRNSDLQGGTPVVVNFNITANDTTGFDQLLASRKGMITQIINDAVLEKGRRSIA
jgi:hypothetical protein